ncbi:SPW repeat protein [Patescibacteria group bacterium]|jgi:hypothetical protein|nr:SPW repeat protein [Patescibacteria group bacterium]
MKILQIIVAIWLVASPWVLDFASNVEATWSSVVSGIFLLILIFAAGGVEYRPDDK